MPHKTFYTQFFLCGDFTQIYYFCKSYVVYSSGEYAAWYDHRRTQNHRLQRLARARLTTGTRPMHTIQGNPSPTSKAVLAKAVRML